jgi:hypothetical protein
MDEHTVTVLSALWLTKHVKELTVLTINQIV